MLVEIPNVKQYEPNRHRRWFQNTFFDLYVWSNGAGDLLGFQLCYEKSGDQRALRFSRELGFQHEGVDQPEDKPGRSMSAIFIANDVLDADALCARFTQDAVEIPTDIREFVIEQLEVYDARGSRDTPEVGDDEMFRLLGSDPEKLAQLAALFVSEHTRLIEAARVALSSNTFAAAKPVLHSIKGMAALIGAKAAAAGAARLEAIVHERESSPASAPPSGDVLRAEFGALQAALLPYRNWFAKWQAPPTAGNPD